MGILNNMTSNVQTTFKSFGSLGPGGAIVSLVEKLMKTLWYDAYYQGDPTMEAAVKQGSITIDLRSQFCKEIFEGRSDWQKRLKDENPTKVYNTLKEISELVVRYI